MIRQLTVQTENAFFRNWQTTLIFTGLMLAISIRLVAFTGDNLEIDVYYMMSGTHLSYKEYTKPGGFAWNVMAPWWAVSQVLGEGLSTHRILPLVLQTITIIILALGSLRLWKRKPYVCIFAVLFFAFNGRAVYYIDYPLIGFSAEILIGGVLYFGFVCASQKNLTSRETLIWTVPLFPLAVLALYPIIVPVFTGLFALFLWKALRASDYCNAVVEVVSIWKLWPCFAIPGIQFLLWYFVPFRFVGKNIMPHNFPYFFYLSGHPQTVAGGIGFVLINTKSWLKGMLEPVFNSLVFERLNAPQVLVYLLFVIAVVLTIGFLAVRRSLNRNIAFTLLFFAVTWSAIIFGGLIGQFPYGTARHTGWLLVPLSVIVGYVAAEWLHALEKLVNADLSFFLFVLVLLSGSFASFYHFQSKNNERNVNYEALDWLNRCETQRVITSGYIDISVILRAPKASGNRIAMGFGENSDLKSEETAESIDFVKFRTDLANGEIQSIAIAAQSKDRFVSLYPSWAKLVFDKFDFRREFASPSLWVGEFHLRRDLSH